MPAKKLIGRILVLLLVFIIIAGVIYAWQAFPIISGYGAKNMASAVFVQNRDPASILKEDLGEFPFTIGKYTVNREDSSVTGSVWGLAKRKAIYRPGLGCTLINDITEDALRKQVYQLATTSPVKMDSLPWPYGNRLIDSIPAVINKQLLQQAIDHAMQAQRDGKAAYTRAVLVVYDGKLVAEQYANGFDEHTVMLGWSISKSLTGALIGVLVRQGKLDVEAPAPVPEWQHTKKQKIRLKDLLQQTSGLDFEENYTKPSEVTNMLFKRGDMAGFTAMLPLKYEPGTVFNYSSGNSNILSHIIRHTVGDKDYVAFPYKALFHKLHMYSTLLEPDASGTFIGSSYSYATARDFARFGLLYYNNGLWNGEQVFPSNWVQQSIQPSAADKLKHYGYQFWLNGYDKKDPSKRMYPDVPNDMFFADGYGGQDIYIIPSKKLVVVRLGLHTIDENLLLKEIIQAIQQ
jgi:CubicO group peptidase (beta-lactamase class C family)